MVSGQVMHKDAGEVVPEWRRRGLVREVAEGYGLCLTIALLSFSFLYVTVMSSTLILCQPRVIFYLTFQLKETHK